MKNSVFKVVLILLLAGGLLAVLMGRPQIQTKTPEVNKLKLVKLPDLQAAIKCPGKAEPGEELGKRIKVVVKNKGLAPARDFSVDLVLSSDTTVPVKYAVYSANYTEDVLLKGGREKVNFLGAGNTIPLTLNGTNKIPDDTPPGIYYLAAVVDPGKKVAESNENNNVGLCRLRISQPLPDLVVTGFAHTGAPAGSPPECRLLVTINNIGAGPVPAGRGRLDVYVNGALVDSISLDSDSVEGTAYHDFHFPYDPTNPGKSRSMVSTGYIFPSSASGESYRCRAVIDPDDVIDESNEGNNSFERVESIPPH